MLKRFGKYVREHAQLAVAALVVGALVGGTAMGAINFKVGNEPKDTVAVYDYKAAAATTFSDVKKHWAAKTIQWGVDNGVVGGYPDGTFQPNRQVSEAEFLVMFIRAYGIEPKAPDAPGHWADAYYNFAVSNNYPLKGITNNDIRNDSMLRVTVAEMLTAADGQNYKGNNAIQYILGKSYSAGTDPYKITIPNFKGSAKLTRAEAVQFIKNAKDQGLKKLEYNPETPSDPSNLPNLPEQLKPLQAKVSKAVEAKLKESGYAGYVMSADNEVLAVATEDANKTMVTFAADSTEDNIVTVWDAADPKAVELAVSMSKAAGFTVTAATINKVVETGTAYRSNGVKVLRNQFDWTRVDIYFRTK